MLLKKVTLNNFRCFESLEINLHPRLTVLVGENGAGKTAILDGIVTALTPVMTYLSSANQRLSGRGIEDADFRLEAIKFQGSKSRRKLADYAQVIAETVDGLQWDYWRPSGSKGSTPQVKYGLSDLKKHLTTIYESYNTGNPALTPVFAYYGTRRGDIDVPERLRESKENYDFPTSALIGALDSKNDFKEFLKWFDREEASELRANKGAANDDYAPSAALQALRDTVKALLGGTYENPYFNKEHKFVIEPQGGGAPLLVTQLSQGYQSMLALGMDFARRMALANSHMDYTDSLFANSHGQNSVTIAFNMLMTSDDVNFPDYIAAPLIAPAIMLVDEIDLHLHPSWQQRVLSDLMRAFPNTQFIVTTHSPQVLTTVKAECIRGLKFVDGKIIVKDDYQFSEGAEAQLALEDILGVTSRAQNLDIVKKLNAYLDLVGKDQWDTPEAIQLRTELDEWSHGHETALLKADMDIRMRQFRRSKGDA